MKTLFAVFALFALAAIAGPPGVAELCSKGGCSDNFKSVLAAAEKGDAEEQNRAGEMLHFGEGAPKAPQAALQWYLRASSQGHAVAANHIGRMYLNGEGVQKDEREACRWYALSAARGDEAGRKNAAWCKTKGWAAVENDGGH